MLVNIVLYKYVQKVIGMTYKIPALILENQELHLLNKLGPILEIYLVIVFFAVL